MQKVIDGLAGRLQSLGEESIEAVVSTLAAELATLERSRPSPGLLLRLLEAVRRAVSEHVPKIAKAYYADRALPLAPAERDILVQVRALYAGLAGLYGICLEHADDNQTAAGMLQRIIDAQVGRMIEDYRGRQTISREAWDALQQAISQADTRGAGVVVVHDPLHPQQKSTAHTAYGRAVLLASAQAGAMTPRHLEATLALIYLLEPFIDCSWQAGGHGGDGAHRVERAGRMRVFKVAGTTHLLNNTRLGSALQACAAKLSAGEPIASLDVLPISRTELSGLLARLHRIWCGGEVRETPREQTDEPARIATGLQSIYLLATGTEFTLPPEFRVYSTGARPGETNAVAREVKNIDGAGDWRLHDRNELGVRASRALEGARVRRGGLACVRPAGGAPILAEVRWAQEDAATASISAGIKFFQGTVAAVPARTSKLMSGNFQDVGQVFLLEKIPQPRLIVPLNWWGEDRVIDIYRNGGYQRLRCGELLMRAGDFEMCRFTTEKYTVRV